MERRKMIFRCILNLLLISDVSLVVKGKILRAGKEFSADFNLIDSNARIKKDVMRTLLKTKSEGECSYNCINEEDCVSFNRHKENGTCELLDVSKFDNVSLLQRDNGWFHYETDDDQQNIGSVCMQLSPCKEYQVCEDTFSRSNPYKCRCRDGFHGLECKTYKGPGSSEKKPSTSSCRLLQMKFKSFPDGDYWFKGRKNSKRCERRVDGRFGMWSSYGPCIGTECGVMGTQERNRTCNNPPPKGGGRDCREIGKSREVKPCDPCTSIFFDKAPYKIISSKLLGTMSKWHKEYQIQFYFKLNPLIISEGIYHHLLHFTTGKQAQYGVRVPLVQVRKRNTKIMIFICSAINGAYNEVARGSFDLDYFKNWVKIDISQLLEGGRYIFRSKIDELLIKDIKNQEARMFSDVSVYIDSPLHTEIKSLYIREIIPNISNFFLNVSQCINIYGTAAAVHTIMTFCYTGSSIKGLCFTLHWNKQKTKGGTTSSVVPSEEWKGEKKKKKLSC